MSRALNFSIFDPSSQPLHQPHTYINGGESKGEAVRRGLTLRYHGVAPHTGAG